jgi:hypothetical protein
MPCYYTGSAEGDRALASSNALTECTDMLCRTLTLIEKHNKGCRLEIELDSDIKKFWKKHKKLDAERKERERQKKLDLRARTLAKLTEEELEALGLFK